MDFVKTMKINRRIIRSTDVFYIALNRRVSLMNGVTYSDINQWWYRYVPTKPFIGIVRKK
jgi:hypothetical protein